MHHSFHSCVQLLFVYEGLRSFSSGDESENYFYNFWIEYLCISTFQYAWWKERDKSTSHSCVRLLQVCMSYGLLYKKIRLRDSCITCDSNIFFISTFQCAQLIIPYSFLTERKRKEAASRLTQTSHARVTAIYGTSSTKLFKDSYKS